MYRAELNPGSTPSTCAGSVQLHENLTSCFTKEFVPTEETCVTECLAKESYANGTQLSTELQKAQPFIDISQDTTSSHGSIKDGGVTSADAVEVLCNLVPVYDVPEGGNILRAAVLVLEVVRMFPDVQAKDWGTGVLDDTGHEGILLILSGGDEKLTVRSDGEPGPAASEAGGGGGVELGLHFVEGTEVGVDLVLDGADGGGVARARTSHEGPEHGVVVVTAAGVNDRGLDLRWESGDVGLDGGKAEPLEAGAVRTIDDLVDVVDVGLVVLGVMDVHGHGVDVRLESFILIGELRKSERHVGAVVVLENEDRGSGSRNGSRAGWAGGAGAEGGRRAGTGIEDGECEKDRDV